jgi:hypothetical protein
MSLKNDRETKEPLSLRKKPKPPIQKFLAPSNAQKQAQLIQFEK